MHKRHGSPTLAEAPKALRSGANWVKTIHPGEHLCALIEQTELLFVALLRFIENGIARNGKVVCILLDDQLNDTLARLYPSFRPRTKSAVIEYLRHHGQFDVTKELASGRLVLLTAFESYLNGGRFDPVTMCATFRQLYDESLAAGFSCLYAFGDMAWSLADYPGVDSLFEYESCVNDLARECGHFVGFCYYDRAVFSPSRLRKALCAHPQASVDEKYFPKNFYYIVPAELLGSKPQDAKLNNWLRNLEERQDVENSLAMKTVELHAKNTELQRQLHERVILENQKQVAELLSQQRNLFVASISHEIRTPLNGITTACSLLEDMQMPSEQARECVQIAQVSSNHLQSLVNNVLTLGALDAGELLIKEERFTISEAINVARKMVQGSIAGKGHRISVNFADLADVGDVLADQKKLVQVLLNMLANSCKFTPPKDGVVHLLCRRVLPSSPPANGGSENDDKMMLEFVISDNGIGIAPEKLASLGRPFHQIERRGIVHDGAGLGLSITMRLLELVGGTFHITSDGCGKGTTVRFRWPAKRAPVGETAVGTRGKDIEEAVVHRNHRATRVLLVEDNEVNCAVTCKLLARLGMQCVSTAKDGAAAVGIVCSAQQRFDVVLMDINLPGELDGIEAAKIIRSLTEPYPPRIIALTADVSAAVEKACEGVMDDFLTKPIQIKKFTAVLNK